MCAEVCGAKVGGSDDLAFATRVDAADTPLALIGIFPTRQRLRKEASC